MTRALIFNQSLICPDSFVVEYERFTIAPTNVFLSFTNNESTFGWANVGKYGLYKAYQLCYWAHRFPLSLSPLSEKCPHFQKPADFLLPLLQNCVGLSQSVMNTSGSCETPPSLIKLAREMKYESSNALPDNSTPTTSPRTSAGHTPYPRAISFNLNEAQVQICSHQILIYRKKPKRESNNWRSGEKFWMRDCVSKMKGYWVWHVSWRYLKIITEKFSKNVYEFGDKIKICIRNITSFELSLVDYITQSLWIWELECSYMMKNLSDN